MTTDQPNYTPVTPPVPRTTPNGLGRALHALFVGDTPSPLAGTVDDLRGSYRYARQGDWCAPDREFARRDGSTGRRPTLIRRLGCVYCVTFAWSFRVVADLVGWVGDRPGRLAAAIALTWLFVAFI